MEQAYYTIKQATQLLQLSQTSIYDGIRKGNIPTASFCGKKLIPAWFFKQGLERNALKVVE
jgi:predicted DNA-binding transcriptional regulator AlpA